MTITPRLHDALAAASRASALQADGERSSASPVGAAMAPVSLTPLALPRARPGEQSPVLSHGVQSPGTVPAARRELFDRILGQLLDQARRRELGALPPSWAGISGRLSQEEAASAAATAQLIAAKVSP